MFFFKFIKLGVKDQWKFTALLLIFLWDPWPDYDPVAWALLSSPRKPLETPLLLYASKKLQLSPSSPTESLDLRRPDGAKQARAHRFASPVAQYYLVATPTFSHQHVARTQNVIGTLTQQQSAGWVCPSPECSRIGFSLTFLT